MLLNFRIKALSRELWSTLSSSGQTESFRSLINLGNCVIFQVDTVKKFFRCQRIESLTCTTNMSMLSKLLNILLAVEKVHFSFSCFWTPQRFSNCGPAGKIPTHPPTCSAGRKQAGLRLLLSIQCQRKSVSLSGPFSTKNQAPHLTLMFLHDKFGLFHHSSFFPVWISSSDFPTTDTRNSQAASTDSVLLVDVC